MNKPYKMKIVPFAARKESGTTDSRTPGAGNSGITTAVMTWKCLFTVLTLTWEWKCFRCLIFPFSYLQSECFSHLAEQSSNEILTLLAL